MRRLALAATVLAFVSCGGDSSGGGSSPTQPVTSVATTIELSTTSVALASLGEAVTLTATVKDQNGAAMTDQTVVWSSSQTGVATVDAIGLVTAVSNGASTITATSGTASATANSERDSDGGRSSGYVYGGLGRGHGRVRFFGRYASAHSDGVGRERRSDLRCECDVGQL